MKRTKIVATMGPACADKAVLKEMIMKGVDVVRLNFSHGSHEDHLHFITIVREIAQETQNHVAILADLQGPKLRVGEMEGGSVNLVNGSKFILTTKKCVGTAERAYVTYPELPLDVRKGENILLDDGKLVLQVIATNDKDEVELKVIHGGPLSSKKGVNLPDTRISQPCLTEKDLKDLDFALTHNVDWVALSFVRSARDIIELRHIIRSRQHHARIIAKIEKPEAINDIDDIIRETDALMVARGDLGVEIPMQKVPVIQKDLVKRCMRNGKPVIIATQMMETMITSITPTRAEVNDVANGVLDGADAVMLSGETSVGKFPIKVIEAMTSIIQEVENTTDIYHKEVVPDDHDAERFITDSICFNACRLAGRVKAGAIVAMTFSGYTAYKISSQRPRADIFVFTGNRQVISQLNLLWGVKTFFYDKMVSTDHTIEDIKYILKRDGNIQAGELVINIASTPIGERGKANTLKLSNA
ncbi:MAG: pyruvate kinase [Luteibaculaceae bacterium]